METLKSKLDPKKLAALLEKLFQLARMAEALARRTINWVRNLALAGLLTAAWLAYDFMEDFTLSMLQALPLLLLFALPSLLLGKLYFVLQETLDLPARLNESVTKIMGKSMDIWQQARQFQAQATATDLKPRFSDLRGLGKVLFELRSYGEEASGIVTVMHETLILSNPLSLISLVASAVFIGLEIFLSLVIGLLRLL